MRLLFVHERFGALGGAEANVLAVAAELRRRGHTLALLHGAATGRDEDAWQAAFPDHMSLASRGAAAVVEAIGAYQPDVIFLHKLSDLNALAALADAGVPVVRMVHDHDLYCLRGYKYNPLTRRICTRAASPYCVFPCAATLARGSGGGLPVRWVSYSDKRRELDLNRRFSRLVVASEFMKAELVQNGFYADHIEIHAPVPQSVEPAFQPTFGPRNRLVYAGQLIRGKGVDVLLESLARLRVPFECMILGDGSHRAACEQLSRKLGLADRVTFAGFVPQSRIAEYYREATVAVMSSLWPEPFGAVGLEAMRCGLPVIAFDAGGIREWLVDGTNGFLVPWMDRARYAEAVEELLRDKALARKLGANGRESAAKRFGFARYIRGLERLFASVAPRPPEITPAAAPMSASAAVPA